MSQLNLPYEVITEVANKSLVKSMFGKSTRESFFVELNKIQERPGFNKRIEYEEIEELAESILRNGLLEPLWLDVLPDGRVFIVRGHRRFKAFKTLVSQGKIDEDHQIEFYPTSQNMTEEFRLLDQYTSNNLQKKLKPLEQASVAYSLKHDFGDEKSNDEVATLLCVSRQKVDNLILIHNAPDDIKNQIREGNMNVSDALSFIRESKRAQKAADRIEEGYLKTPTSLPEQKDPLQGDINDLKRLEQEGSDNSDEPLDLVGNRLPSERKQSEKEEVKYDESREEIKLVQNVIKNMDKLEAIVRKLDVPDQTKSDVNNLVEWSQRDLAEIREWVHKNKKQNKAR